MSWPDANELLKPSSPSASSPEASIAVCDALFLRDSDMMFHFFSFEPDYAPVGGRRSAPPCEDAG